MSNPIDDDDGDGDGDGVIVEEEGGRDSADIRRGQDDNQAEEEMIEELEVKIVIWNKDKSKQL